MRHTNPLVSLSSIILTTLMLGWLGINLWLDGGMAFNPGLLTAQSSGSHKEFLTFRSHAEFEKECERCHQPLKTDQASLCLDCHTDVAAETLSATGVHSQISNFNSCRTCHPDHRGREFSPLAAAAQFYNHESTGFVLIKHQVAYDASLIECKDCHLNITGGGYEYSQETCISCHQSHDAKFIGQHLADYGKFSCLDCHDGADHTADFTHETSQFPLTGQHTTLACSQCHLGSDSLPRFTGLSGACANCHSEPSLHKGLFDNLCENCHTAEGWKPVVIDGQLFDHAIQGKFSLAAHTSQPNTNLICSNCHTSDLKESTEPACINCHTQEKPEFMAKHTQQFGGTCISCHDGVDRYSNFDHNQYFVLDGRHVELDCASCHGSDPSSAIYRGLGKGCIDCHAEPDIHAGTFGIACQDCHSTSAWSPAALRVHNFPLDHGEQGQIACETCHTTRYTEYTCYSCHEHDQQKVIEEHSKENINQVELQNCVRCHPAGQKEEGD